LRARAFLQQCNALLLRPLLTAPSHPGRLPHALNLSLGYRRSAASVQPSLPIHPPALILPGPIAGLRADRAPLLRPPPAAMLSSARAIRLTDARTPASDSTRIADARRWLTGCAYLLSSWDRAATATAVVHRRAHASIGITAGAWPRSPDPWLCVAAPSATLSPTATSTHPLRIVTGLPPVTVRQRCVSLWGTPSLAPLLAAQPFFGAASDPPPVPTPAPLAPQSLPSAPQSQPIRRSHVCTHRL
jgi:hypothetical protein